MTFREKSINKLYAFAMAAVFALVLAGCGGGGGGAATTPPDTGTTPSLSPAEQAASAASNAASAAKAIADAISDDEAVADQKAAAMAAYMEASAAATAAQAAVTGDDEVEARVQQRLAENARDEAQMYANAATKVLADAAAAADKKAMNEMVVTKATAISNEADSTTGQTRPFDSTTAFDTTANANNSSTNYRVQIEYDDGAMVTITDGALTAKNDPKFEMMDGKYMRDNGGGVTEIVSVMTDIEAPKSVPFTREYDLTENDDPDRTGNQFRTYAVLADDNDKIASSAFPSTPDTTRTFDAEDEFRGTFDGAQGMFECVATGGCTITTDDEGEIGALAADNWQFTPDAGAMVSVADDDYLHYGFWLKKTVKDGVTTYDEVQTFAGSSLAATTNLAAVVDGSAKYKGDAHGVYTYYTVNPDTSVDGRSAGTFTADVALTAYFGTQTSVAADKHNKLEGSVSNFELSGGESNNWEITLGVSPDADISSAASFINGVAMVKGQADATWSASFHGDGAAVTGNTTGTAAPPPVVVGEFNGNFNNGSVAGAFGARRQ